MHIARRITALCFSLLILMMNAAHAEISFFAHADSWNLEGRPLEVLLKADVSTHMPFDDDRLAMLTPIIDLLSLRIVAAQDAGSVTISIGEYDALTLQYQGNELQISSQPDVTYVAQQDPIALLLGSEATVTDGYDLFGLSPDGESLLADGRALLEKLPAQIEQYGKRSTNTTNISGYGKAAYRYDYTIAAKEAEKLQEILLGICPEGWLREIISGLTFSGKQTLRVYYNEQDELLRAEYNGGCGPEGDIRTVKLIYKQQRSDELAKDYVELTSPAKKSSNKNSLTFERSIGVTDSKRSVQGSFTYTAALDGTTNTRKGSFSLTNTVQEDAEVVSGSVTFENKLNGAEAYTAITLAPQLTISGTQENPLVTGTLTLTEEYANRETEHAVISIEMKAAEPLEWLRSSQTIDISALDAAALEAERQQVLSGIATAIVHPLILMMGEDGEWFFRELPADAIDAIIEAAEMSGAD